LLNISYILGIGNDEGVCSPIERLVILDEFPKFQALILFVVQARTND